MAAPIRGASGAVSAALAVVAPSIHLEDLDTRALALDVVRLASRLQDGTHPDTCV